MGYLVDGKCQPFLNEVEYVPSLYAEDVSEKNVHDYISQCARQMVMITRKFNKSSSRKGRKNHLGSRIPASRHVLKKHVSKRK